MTQFRMSQKRPKDLRWWRKWIIMMKQAGKKDLQMLELDLCVNANHDFSVTRVHIWRLNFKVILGKRLDLNDTSQCWTDGCRPEISDFVADFVRKEGSRKGGSSVKMTREKILQKGLKRMFWPKRATKDQTRTKRGKNIINCPQNTSVFVQTKLRIRGGNCPFPPFPFLVTFGGQPPHFKTNLQSSIWLTPKSEFANWLVEDIAGLLTSNFWPWLSSTSVK